MPDTNSNTLQHYADHFDFHFVPANPQQWFLIYNSQGLKLGMWIIPQYSRSFIGQTTYSVHYYKLYNHRFSVTLSLQFAHLWIS